MYEQYYGLSEKPFSLTPDTAFYYQSYTHQEALNALLAAIKSGGSLVKVTGEVGTGKTLMGRKLLDTLEPDYETAYIPNPYITCDAVLNAVLVELGIASKVKRDDYLACINDHLIESARRHKGAVIIFDEAQSLSEESLEAIRLLSNLQTGGQQLVQIVLFGQPELDKILAQSNIHELGQRIMHACELQPLSAESIRYYLQHRVKSAGYRGPELFDIGAQRRIYKFSQGIPRVINVLCNKAMMLSYTSGEFYVQRKHIEAAAAESKAQSASSTAS